MNSAKTVLLAILLVYTASFCECYERNEIESRGKKKKIALFVYFADLVLKKFFILKLVYAFVFWVVLHKAGYFLAWFASYLKEQKKEEHHHPPHYDYHEPSYGPSYEPSYGPSYGPYRRKTYGV